jgi:hypothetical protein
MPKDSRRVAPQAAFIPIGAAFIAIGMNGNRGLVAAGIVFMIAGIAAVVQKRKPRD